MYSDMGSSAPGAYPPFSLQGAPQQAINPAMLASFNRQQQGPSQFPGGGISPAQLLNGGGMMNSNSMLQQQQQQQQMMLMNGAGGLNPAALSAAANGMHGGGGMNPAALMNNGGPSSMMQQQPMQISPQAQQMLANSGITREQFSQMTLAERQAAMKNVMVSARLQQMQMQNQQQMQLQQQSQHFSADQGGFFDRPGSAMGMRMGGGGGMGVGIGMNNMNNINMMPPPQRPGTAQGMMRPDMSMGGMHQPQGLDNGMGMNMGMPMGGNMGMGMGGNMGMPRPPSRAASLGAGDFFPQITHQQQNGFMTGKSQGSAPFGPGLGGATPGTPRQNTAQGSPPPGSPYNLAKRKLPPSETQSPRISPMGPPPVLRSSSSAEANGFVRPPSSNGTPQRQQSFPPPGAQTPQRQPSIPRSMSPMKPGSVDGAPPPPAVVPQITALTAAALPNLPPPAAAPPPPPIIPALPSLPASVKLNPAITRVSVVPLATSLTDIPPVCPEEVAQVKEWMAADRAYEGVYREMKTRMAAEFGELVGQRNVPWWEKGTLAFNASRFITGRQPFEVRYPYRKRERDASRRKGARREGIRLPRKIDPEDANRPEQLVPIRLEFDVEHHKMRDTFIWNLNDPVISPEDFAQTVVEDYKLAPTYHSAIVKTIQDQLSDYRAHSANYDGDSWDVTVTEDTLRPGSLDGESAAWWSAWRKRLRPEYTAGRRKEHKRRKIKKEDDDMDEADERPMAVEEFTFDTKALQDDMRIVIRLDIIAGSIKLDDQFEWDLENTNASPEGFAEIYAKELGLGGEFKTAIAHSIREQVQAYHKSLFLVGQPTDGTPVQDEDLRNSILPSLSSGARSLDQVQSFTPQLNYLSDGELERNEKERDKDTNKRRKKTRGGRRGVALPDREPVRTWRTPAIGFPELDAATLAAAAAANAPMSRRAAAAAASVTIANMVASENGERAYTPSSLPAVPVPPPLVIKEKTIKGFFKPPPYDTSILRPRARIHAPILSTAADVSRLPAPLENDPPPPLTSTVMPPESRSSKAGLLPKRGKDDRESRDKEIVDGQRRNMINGVWHCSNCGCPESVAIGRRKGPLGEKSQCGTCGKYWHRHRRPRPVEYNTDLEYHANLKREAEFVKTVAKRRGGAAALRAQGANVPATPGETPSRQSPTRDLSPISDASSTEELPLAQRVKINGTSHVQATPTPPPETQAQAKATPSPVVAPASIPVAPSTPRPTSTAPVVSAQPPPPPESAFSAPPTTPAVVPPAAQTLPAPGPNSSADATPTTPTRGSNWPPQWLSNALQAMQAKWENDKFEITLRKVNATSTPEWRIKCLDCPGKLYQPGPNETLSNYEVHLRNRLHRQRVNDRMGNSSNS